MRIGTSDTSGDIQIEPGKSRIEFYLVKHGGQLMAKVPIVAGAERRTVVPTPSAAATRTMATAAGRARRRPRRREAATMDEGNIEAVSPPVVAAGRLWPAGRSPPARGAKVSVALPVPPLASGASD